MTAPTARSFSALVNHRTVAWRKCANLQLLYWWVLVQGKSVEANSTKAGVKLVGRTLALWVKRLKL